MKRKFTFLTAAFMLLTFLAVPQGMRGQTRTVVTYTFSEHYSANTVLDETPISFDQAISATFNKRSGGTATQYYTNGYAVRWYGGGTLAFVATDATMSEIEITYTQTANSISASVGTYSLSNSVGTWTGSASSVTFTQSGTSGHCRISAIKVTYSSSSTAVATTTTIDDNDITNTDIADGTAAGSLSATVTYDNGGTSTEVPGATVTWSGDNDAVATINPSTGAVTLVGMGTVTFTASYAGEENEYQASSDTYEMTVTDSRYEVSTLEFTAACGGSGTADDGAEWTVTSDGTESVYDATSGIHYGTSSATVTYVQLATTDINGIVSQVVVNTRDAQATASVTVTVGGTSFECGGNTSVTATNTSTDYTFTGTGSGEIVIRIDRGESMTKAIYVKRVVVRYEPSTDPYFTVTNPDILNYNATNGSFNFTLSNPVASGSISVDDNAEWISEPTINGNATDGYSVSFTTTENTANTQRQGTITLTYTYGSPTQTVTEEVTITQAAAPVIYSTIPALFEAATTTATDVLVTFNNWVVSGVSTNGKNVFVTDRNGNGFVINGTDLDQSYSVGKQLSGTAVECSLKLNKGYAQLTNVDASDLTQTDGEAIAFSDIAMASLAGVNTGALVHYEDLTCSVTTSGNYTNYYLSDGGTTSIQVYGSLYSFGSLTADKKYDISGVYQQYDDTKEVLPRSAADVVLKANMSDTDFTSLTSFTYVLGNGPSAAQTVDVYCYDLGTNTLTATATAGYELSLDATGTYTSSVVMTPDEGDVLETLYIRLAAGLEDGDYNGTLTFTAANLTTVEVDLTGTVSATQNYTIALSQPTVATIAADVLIAEAGTTITLSYSNLDDCYTFTGWTVLDGNADLVPVNNNLFEMPASNVVVEGNFSQKTFTISYSVNGTIYEVLEEDVDCGENAPLHSASDLDGIIELPSGYSFGGWSTAANSATPVSSFTPTDDATLYAVLLPTGAILDYVKVTENLTDWSGDYLIVNEEFGVAFDGSIDNSTYDKTNNTVTVTINTTDGIITAANAPEASRFIVEKKGEAYTIKSAAGYYIGRTSSSTGINASDVTEYTNTFNFAYTIMSVKASNNYVLRYNSASDQKRFRYYSGASVKPVQLYKKQTIAGYTLVKEVTGTETMVDIEACQLVTVKNGGVLTLTGTNNGDETNLIIEDGGQLYTEDVVEATIKKNITGYNPTLTGSGVSNGWYFISSPLNCDYEGINPEDVNNMTDGEFDLYLFDPNSDKEWVNFEGDNGGFGLINGHGYLYANENTVTLEFAGSLNYFNEDFSSLEAGYNLIGNPYAYNAYPNMPYYKMNDDHTAVTAETSDDAVEPCTGIIVDNTDGLTPSFEFTKDKPVTNANNGSLEMSLSQAMATRGGNATIDNAIVSFNEGSQLGKFYFGQSNANIYIPQNGKDYAIVSAEAQGEMPVNFKAKENGTYTLNVNADNVEMNYLHLIDNLTGNDVDLLATPNYTFEARKSDYASRFRLVFNANNADNNDNFAFVSNGQIILSNADANTTVQVIDALGRIIVSTNATQRVATDGMTAGVYVVRLINGNDVKTQKIVVK